MNTDNNWDNLNINIIKYSTIILLYCGIVLSPSCSVRKNTKVTRAYHEVNTKYNVNFNGYESLNEGLKTIKDGHRDNYSEVLPVFPFDQSQFDIVKSQMTRAQAKAEKAIKRHSIKQKPKKNPVKYREDANYYAFYNQEEFNTQLNRSWILLGQAQFYQGEFMRAIGTFSFIADKYQTIPITHAKSLIWKARCYSELGWFLESDMLLSEVNKDGFPEEITSWYASVLTDLRIKEGRYKEAIPPLLLAIENEKVRSTKLRYRFILAQIYQELNQTELAYKEYSSILKKFPNLDLGINTRIKRAEVLNEGEEKKIYKQLTRLLKKHKDDSYTCKIYYALGNVSLKRVDTAKAINYYEKALEVNEKDEEYIGLTDLALGDIYTRRQEYRRAAIYNIPSIDYFKDTHRNYKKVKEISTRYKYFASVYDEVQLQDSLAHLASLPESERAKIIDDLIKKEEKKQLDLKNQAVFEASELAASSEISKDPVQNGAWYFYNPEVVEQGKKEFKKMWGDRVLVDNWRTRAALGNNPEQSSKEYLATDDSPESPSVDRDAYTQNIPLSEDAKSKSRSILEKNLLSLAYSYQYDMLDYPMSIASFLRYENEFPNSSDMPSVYYALYSMSDSLGNKEFAQIYREKLLNNYANTRFEVILTDPNYVGKVAELTKQEEQEYDQIYSNFIEDKPLAVIQQAENFRKQHQDSPMFPQVLYMEAIAMGKQGNMEGFRSKLTEIKTKYNESDIAPLSEGVLLLFEQDSSNTLSFLPSGSNLGLISEKDKEIDQLREFQKGEVGASNEEIPNQEFSYKPREKHYWAIWVNDTTNLANDILYETAKFNFTRFENENYGLLIKKIKYPESLVLIGSFSDYQDAADYGEKQAENTEITELTENKNYSMYAISDKNLRLLVNNKNTESYQWFYNKFYLGKKDAKPIPVVDKAPNFVLANDIHIDSIDEYDINDRLQYSLPEKEEVKEIKNYKGFEIQSDSVPNYYGIAYWEGNINLDSLQLAVDQFMQKYDSTKHLTIKQSTNDKMKLILIGSLGDKPAALKCFLAIVKDPAIRNVLKTTPDYRNAIITQRNAALLMETNNIPDYSEFFSKIYMKK